MNWVQFQDLHCSLCLYGTVVSFLSIAQEIMGSNYVILPFWFFFVTEISEISENSININQILGYVLDQNCRAKLHVTRKK